MTMTLMLQNRSSRWWLIGSLALNLFFIGTIGAMAVRHNFAPAQPAAPERPRTALARIERVAAPLPPADAEKLRAAYQARARDTESARAALNLAVDRMQVALKAHSFDPAQFRAGLAEVRAARSVLDQAMQEIYIAAAGEMTPEGRQKLSEWGSPRPNAR